MLIYAFKRLQGCIYSRFSFNVAYLVCLQSPNYWQTVKMCIISYHIFFMKLHRYNIVQKVAGKNAWLIKNNLHREFPLAPNFEQNCNIVK